MGSKIGEYDETFESKKDEEMEYYFMSDDEDTEVGETFYLDDMRYKRVA